MADEIPSSDERDFSWPAPAFLRSHTSVRIERPASVGGDLGLRWLLRLANGVAVLASVMVQGAVIREDFAGNPSDHGWIAFGDVTAFTWDQSGERLNATWDSKRANTFFARPLGTTLARADDFRFRFVLQLSELRTGADAGTFQLAVGLVRLANATHPDFYRGAGIHPQWGPRNLVEFDYFPASGAIAPTFSAVAVATNNLRWAMVNLFPFELTLEDRFEIEVIHDSAAGTLALVVARNGEPFASGSTVIDARFGDFRVDAFSVTSYSGEHQPAGYGGQLWARGSIDNVEITFPDAPQVRAELSLGIGTATVATTAPSGWIPRLERSVDLTDWEDLDSIPRIDGSRWIFEDPAPPPRGAHYRVRLERP